MALNCVAGAHIIILIFLVFSFVDVRGGRTCSDYSTCSACTDGTGCVWCLVDNGTYPYTPSSSCVGGTLMGSSDSSNQCSQYYWLMCTVSSTSMGNDYTYLIGLVLVIALLLIIIISIIAVALHCKKSKAKRKKAKAAPKTKPNTLYGSPPPSYRSATVGIKKEDDDLHRTLLRTALDKPSPSSTPGPSASPSIEMDVKKDYNTYKEPASVITIPQEEPEPPYKETASAPTSPRAPRKVTTLRKPDLQSAAQLDSAPEPVPDPDMGLDPDNLFAPPTAIDNKQVDVLDDFDLISADLDEILKDLVPNKPM